MKKIKKYLSVFLAEIIFTLPAAQPNASANGDRVQALVPKSSVVVRLRKNKKIQEKINRLSRHLNKNYNVSILDGGSYGNTSRSDGYECHHLISSHFCKRHRYLISRYRSPAVLIPKAVHKLTGSHPRSGRMRYYFKLEKRFYKEWGLHGVVALGIMDLIYAFKRYNKLTNATGTPVKSSNVANQTPIKDALVQLEIVSPWKTPFISKDFVSPMKDQTYHTSICTARRLIFNDLDD